MINCESKVKKGVMAMAQTKTKVITTHVPLHLAEKVDQMALDLSDRVAG